MSFAKNKLHQMEYVYDFSIDGGAIGVISLSDKDGKSALPEGALVKRAMLVVEEACTSGGSATVAIGTEGDSDKFSTSARAVAALTANAVFDYSTLYRPDGTAANQNVVAEIATAALTAGKIRCVVEFFMPGLEG